MKKAIIPILIFWVFCSCESNNGKLSGDLVNNPASATVGTNTKEPKIVFETTEHDFGKMLQGEKVSYTYKFKNEGNAPLLITTVEKTCGCTNITFPNAPIKPGESGTISIIYDSDGYKGIQNKSVVVKANTNPAQTILRFRASVETVLDY